MTPLLKDDPTGLDDIHQPPDFNVDATLTFHNDLPADLLAMWQERCDGDRLPARGDFDVFELRDYLGWLCIAEETPMRDDYVYRLIGTKVVQNVGRDVTGRTVGESLPPAALKIFRYMEDHPAPLRTWGTVNWQERAYRNHESLLLPLANDGVRVDRFLILMMFFNKDG